LCRSRSGTTTPVSIFSSVSRRCWMATLLVPLEPLSRFLGMGVRSSISLPPSSNRSPSADWVARRPLATTGSVLWRVGHAAPSTGARAGAGSHAGVTAVGQHLAAAVAGGGHTPAVRVGASAIDRPTGALPKVC